MDTGPLEPGKDCSLRRKAHTSPVLGDDMQLTGLEKALASDLGGCCYNS